MESNNRHARRKPINKKLLWTGLVLLSLAVLLFARSKTGSAPAQSHGKGRSGPPGTAEVEVSTLVLQPEAPDQNLISSGTVLAQEEVDLRAETDGRIIRLLLKEGERVKKGALLVKINDAELKAKLEMLALRTRLAAEREFRQRELLTREIVSQEEYDLALQEKNSLMAEKNLLQAQIEKTEIRAPFDGMVGLKTVSEGAYITPGTVIAGFFSLHPLKIDFSIPEQYFSQVNRGDTLSIGIEGLEKEVKGVVYAIEPKIDPATRMLRIRAHCPNEDGRIPPGASARIRLSLSAGADVLMAPSNAVLPDIKGQKVFLYKGGKAATVPVTTGFRSEDRVQISGGVRPGDTLITSSLILLKPESPVKLAGSQ